MHRRRLSIETLLDYQVSLSYGRIVYSKSNRSYPSTQFPYCLRKLCFQNGIDVVCVQEPFTCANSRTLHVTHHISRPCLTKPNDFLRSASCFVCKVSQSSFQRFVARSKSRYDDGVRSAARDTKMMECSATICISPYSWCRQANRRHDLPNTQIIRCLSSSMLRSGFFCSSDQFSFISKATSCLILGICFVGRNDSTHNRSYSFCVQAS